MAVEGYREFLEGKAVSPVESGFDPGGDVSPVLFPHQRDIVRWACAGGRRAIFAAFGLGKSLMQLEIMRLVLAHQGGRALIRSEEHTSELQSLHTNSVGGVGG